MRIDAGLLKDILEELAEVGYSRRPVAAEQINIGNVPKDKLEFHVVHLIKEGYLDGDISGNWHVQLVSGRADH